MKLHFLIMSLLSLFTFGCSTAPSFKSVGVKEFEQIAQDPETVVVDVRRADEWVAGHLELAQYNIDVLQDNFIENAKATLPKDKTIAIYCRSGRRSKEAANRLVECGFEVIELNEGIIGWQNSGREVVK